MRGRIRTVKPEALKDEELWDLEAKSGLPLYRAFQGLWCFADREGRFEWRPRALKSDILPYWDGDFDRCLVELAAGGFVQRYEVDGRVYGLVPNLSRHQRFDHREPQSELPAPPGRAQEPPGRARADERGTVDDVAARPGGREGNGREQEGKGTEARADADTHTPPPSGIDHGALKPSERDQAAAEPRGQPVLKYEFDPDWKPKSKHRARGLELGLTDDEILERAEDCRLKVHKQGFRREDTHFMRELGWAKLEKETRKAKELHHASRHRFESPGADRA